jgi:hypothetical protein
MNRRPLGAARLWARDFALLGLISGVAIPFASIVFVARSTYFGHAMDAMGGYLIAAGLLGLLTGAVVGPLIRHGLLRAPRVPFGAWMLAIPALAAVWGMSVASAAVPLGMAKTHAGDGALAAMCGALGAAIQIGWFWPLYLGRRVRQRPATTLLVAAALTSALIGPAVLWCVVR